MGEEIRSKVWEVTKLLSGHNLLEIEHILFEVQNIVKDKGRTTPLNFEDQQKILEKHE